MKLFDPENAEMVDEAVETELMESFTQKIDKQMATIRDQLIATAIKEQAAARAKEQEKLVSKISDAFSQLVKTSAEEVCARVETVSKTVDSVAKVADSVAAELELQSKRANNRMDALNAKSKELSETLTALANKPPPEPPEEEDDEDEEDDQPDPQIKAILEVVQKLQNTPAPARPTWNFQVKRDDYSRITNIIATPST